VLLATLTALMPVRARAEDRAARLRAVLSSLFPDSERVRFVSVPADSPRWVDVDRRLGSSGERTTPLFFRATTGTAVDGFAAVGRAMGRSHPFGYAVRLSATGEVERVVITDYRSPGGRQVLEERFRRQFVGKSARDRLRVGEDVDAISGATISSRSIIHELRRTLLLFDELVRPRRKDRETTPP